MQIIPNDAFTPDTTDWEKELRALMESLPESISSYSYQRIVEFIERLLYESVQEL